jgi:dienelactone hydrolase
MQFKCVFALLLIPVIALADQSAPRAIEVGDKFTAVDTLTCDDESSTDAKECLAGIAWKPAAFSVELQAAERGCGDFLVRFPSPRPNGNKTNDLAAMEWYASRDDAKVIRKAPALVVVHESGSRMTIGRMIARGLGGQGIHTFLLHLPNYGVRRAPGAPRIDRTISMSQGIADVRRARDAVASLPIVGDSKVGVQGTSLGGFVTATTAGLDHGFDRVFIFLAGGNLEEVVLHGAHDAAKARRRLNEAGISDEEIKKLAHQVEPLRLAHRINPKACWLFNGKYDDVVPPKCTLALAKAAGLAEDHHIELPADHYSGMIYMPQVMEQIRKLMTEPATESKSEQPEASAAGR